MGGRVSADADFPCCLCVLCTTSRAVYHVLATSYMHNSLAPGVGRIGSLVALSSDTPLEGEAASKAHALSRTVAMHVVAATPIAMTRDTVDTEALQVPDWFRVCDLVLLLLCDDMSAVVGLACIRVAAAGHDIIPVRARGGNSARWRFCQSRHA